MNSPDKTIELAAINARVKPPVREAELAEVKRRLARLPEDEAAARPGPEVMKELLKKHGLT